MYNKQSGAINAWMITTIFLIIALLFSGSATVLAYMNYFNEKNTVNTQVETAVTEAKKAIADADAAKFAAQEKLPTRTFAGPDNYGRLSFSYPKTWSVYVDKDGSATTGTVYSAYLHPIAVPSISVQNQQFATRVTIEQKDYSTVVAGYTQQVKSGDLKSSPVKVNETDGVRLDGNFSKDIRGSAVIFKIRDKTVTIRTDADTFDTDYNALIASIKFNS